MDDAGEVVIAGEVLAHETEFGQNCSLQSLGSRASLPLAAGCRGFIRGAKSLMSAARDGRRQQAAPRPPYTAQSLSESGVRIFSLVARVFMNYLIS